MASIEHYLPQFLLRGFAARVDRGRHHVYLFRRGSVTAHLANVRDVAGEREFYGVVKAAAVEPAVTAKDDEYAPLVNRLRIEAVGPGDKPLVDAMILHLVARGKHLRESGIELAAQAVDVLEKGLRSPEEQMNLLLGYLDQNEDIRAAFERIPPEQRELVRQGLRMLMGLAVASGGVGVLLERAFAYLKNNLDIPEAARAGQGDAILREPSSVQPRPALAALSWEVRRGPASPYILGDVGVIAQYSEAGLTHLINRGGAGELQAVLLPISSSALLVGATAADPDVVEAEINVASSKLSRQFYVAASDGPEQAAYLPLLGAQSAVVDEATVREWFRDLMAQQQRSPE